MKYERLLNLTNDLASDFLLLSERNIDVPTAGKYLNIFEEMVKEADALSLMPLKHLLASLNILLEKIILKRVDDEKGFSAFEEGVTNIQEVVDAYNNKGHYENSIKGFLEKVAELTETQIMCNDTEKEGNTVGVKKELLDDTSEEEKKVEAAELEKNTTEFKIEDEALLRDFITEGLEYIDEIEVNILNLEQEPENKDYINAIFRPFHSIKGVASFLNLDKIRDLAHALENLLDRARSQELPVTPVLIDIVLDGADALKSMIEDLRSLLEGSIDTLPLLELTDLKERIDNIDKLTDGEGEVKKLGLILVENGVLSEESLEETLNTAQETPHKKIGEALIGEGKATPKQVSQALRKQSRQAVDTNTIRVDVKKLDDLIDMIGELVITQSMIKQNATVRLSSDRKLLRDVSQLTGITSELQRASTSLRMIPIKQSFQRMARLVRDLAKDAGKIINVEMEGEDTEIDRNMVEEIYNPLVHMIRNSVDHGLETPEERIKAGKPEKGMIRLRAYHKGSNIAIEVSDDGRGLNKEKILKKAISNGLIKSPDGLSDKEIYKLIFKPGFSTADKVTNVSGRGVGMDVVKQAVEKLRGKTEIRSEKGIGTTFANYFPLTLAIIDGMIVRVGNEKFIVPTTAIRRLLRPTRKSYNRVVGKGETLNVMGSLLPVIRLHEIFGIKAEKEDPWEALVVVVDVDNRSKCLMVDEVLDKNEVVIKSLGDGLKDINGISGGAILGDGNVGLILDPEGLFKLSENYM